MKKILLFAGAIVLLGALAYKGLPVNKTTTAILSPQAQQQPTVKKVIGFLPYWQIGTVDTMHFSLLTDVIYFGLHIDKTGTLLTKDSDGNQDLGMTRFTGAPFTSLAQEAKKNNTNVSVAIILQDNEAIESFVRDSSARTNLINNVSMLLSKQQINGINLDFEYAGIPGRETVAAYTDFVSQFSKELKKQYPTLIVSVDATADAIKKSRLYDVEKLAKDTDYVVLMGYDFYRPTSSVAGPVAPLTGKELYEYDITTAIADFLTVVPKEKLILGVAYYGWDFPTVDETRGSMVETRPHESVALSSYKRNRQLIEQHAFTIRLDTESQTPWIVYKDPDTNGIRQIWFEDAVSLGKKYDLVNKTNMAGIAIWALGYDGSYPDLWNLLKEKFPRN